MGDQNDQSKFNVEITFEDTVVTYEDVIGYQMGANAVAVMTKDNETIIYPTHQFIKVRHYPAAV